jgi:hypothetical protein
MRNRSRRAKARVAEVSLGVEEQDVERQATGG